MEIKKAIELYNFFIKEGYDLGSQENFLGTFQDDKLRVELFNFFTEKEGYDLGVVEDFVLKKKDSSDVIGDQEPMESPSPEIQEPFSSESSNDPKTPTAPIDPTTGLPFQEEQKQEENFEDDMNPLEGSESSEGLEGSEATGYMGNRLPVERDQTEDVYGRGEFFIEGSQEKDTYLEQVVGKNSFTDVIGDVYRSMKSGAIQGNTSDEAASLMFSGDDATDEQIQAFLESQESLQSQGQTDEMLNFNKIYDKADNKIVGVIEGLVKNPSVFLQIGAQTITQLINPASIGAGLGVIGTASAVGGAIGGPLAAAAAGFNPATLRTAFAAASTALETSLSFGEFLREETEKKGLEFNQEGIRQVLNDPEAFNRSWKRAVGRGATIGIIDRLSLGMGGKAIKSIKGVKKMTQLSKLQKAKIGTAALGSEAIGGGVGEMAARAVAGQEQDVRETVFESIGGFGKAPVSYVINTVTDPVTSPIKDAVISAANKKFFKPGYILTDAKGGKLKQTKEDVIDTIENTDDVTFMGLNYTIKNDPELKDKYDTRKMTIITGDNIRQKLKEAGLKNKKQIDKIVALEIEKNGLEGNTTEVGKQALKDIKAKIAELSGITDVEVDADGNTISGNEKVVQESGKNPKVEGLNPLNNDGRRSGRETVQLNDDGTITIDNSDRDRNNRTRKYKSNTDSPSGRRKLFGRRSEKSDNVYIVENEKDEVDPSYFGQKDRDVAEREQISRADAAAKALSKFLPGVNFVLHRSTKSYAKAGGSRKSNGMFIPSTNDIHINMTNADKQVIAHEVLHAIIRNKYADISQITRNMARTLFTSIKDPALIENIREFQTRYKNPNQRPEEALTRFVGIMASKFDTLTPVEKTTIQKWIEKIVNMFSLPKSISNVLVADGSNIKEILTAISKDVTEGTVIDDVDISAFDTDEQMGVPIKDAEGPVPSNIKDDGPDIELSLESQVDRGGIDISKIKRGSINDLSGSNAFVFAADQATYGMIESPSGLKFMFNGGFLYPYGSQSQGSNSGWVFSNEAAGNKILTKIQESDGVGLVMAQAASGVSGNLQFYDFLNAEIAYAIEKGASPKEMVDYINLKLADKTKDGKDGKITSYLKSNGLPTQIRDYQELQDLFKTTNFEVRGNFARKFMSADSFKKFRIYPFEAKKTVDGNIEETVNDPSLKDVQYGDVVSAIQFDKNGKVVRLNEGDPGYHPAYPFSLPGKPIMVFNKSVDVRNIYPKAKPANLKMNQTPLGERVKKEAARSAMGGQYTATIPKDVKTEDTDVVLESAVDPDTTNKSPKDKNQTYLFTSLDATLVKEVETNILKGLNQEYKTGLKNIREYLKTLRNNAKLQNYQLSKILDLVVDEEAFTTDESRAETVDKIKKILIDADKRAELSDLRKKAIQVAKNLKRSIGRILADAISGKDITLESLLREVIIIDPSVVPDNVYQDYKDIINGLGDRLIMLDNAEEAGVVAQKARNVLEAMTTVESRIPQLRNIFTENAITNKKGDILFKKTLDFLIENDLIT